MKNYLNFETDIKNLETEIEKLKDHPQIEFLQMFEEHEDGTYLRAPWKTPWGFPKIDPIKS